MPCLKAWADSLGGIYYPLLSDFFPHGEVARLYGVLRPEGFTERAIFIVDKQGLIRYIDIHDIDHQPENEEIFRVLAELEPEAAARYAALAQAASTAPAVASAQPAIASPQPAPAAAAYPPVTLYCTPWCPDCKRARLFLKEHGVEFREVDISRDRLAARQVREWASGKEITPTFDVGGAIVIDYNKPKLAAALGIEMKDEG